MDCKSNFEITMAHGYEMAQNWSNECDATYNQFIHPIYSSNCYIRNPPSQEKERKKSVLKKIKAIFSKKEKTKPERNNRSQLAQNELIFVPHLKSSFNSLSQPGNNLKDSRSKESDKNSTINLNDKSGRENYITNTDSRIQKPSISCGYLSINKEPNISGNSHSLISSKTENNDKESICSSNYSRIAENHIFTLPVTDEKMSHSLQVSLNKEKFNQKRTIDKHEVPTENLYNPRKTPEVSTCLVFRNVNNEILKCGAHSDYESIEVENKYSSYIDRNLEEKLLEGSNISLTHSNEEVSEKKIRNPKCKNHKNKRTATDKFNRTRMEVINEFSRENNSMEQGLSPEINIPNQQTRKYLKPLISEPETLLSPQKPRIVWHKAGGDLTQSNETNSKKSLEETRLNINDLQEENKKYIKEASCIKHYYAPTEGIKNKKRNIWAEETGKVEFQENPLTINNKIVFKEIRENLNEQISDYLEGKSMLSPQNSSVQPDESRCTENTTLNISLKQFNQLKNKMYISVNSSAGSGQSLNNEYKPLFQKEFQSVSSYKYSRETLNISNTLAAAPLLDAILKQKEIEIEKDKDNASESTVTERTNDWRKQNRTSGTNSEKTGNTKVNKLKTSGLQMPVHGVFRGNISGRRKRGSGSSKIQYFPHKI